MTPPKQACYPTNICHQTHLYPTNVAACWHGPQHIYTHIPIYTDTHIVTRTPETHIHTVVGLPSSSSSLLLLPSRNILYEGMLYYVLFYYITLGKIRLHIMWYHITQYYLLWWYHRRWWCDLLWWSHSPASFILKFRVYQWALAVANKRAWHQFPDFKLPR